MHRGKAQFQPEAWPLSYGFRSPDPATWCSACNRREGWEGRTTCSVFVLRKGTAEKGLRLDYGYNKATKTVDYHWNQKSYADRFPGITNHMPAGRIGAVLYRSAKAFRGLGEVMVVYGVTVNIISVVQASNHFLRFSEVVSAWALAWAGAEVGGQLGAQAGAFGGSLVEPGLGTAVGGIVFGLGGAIYGGYKGYQYGERAGDMVYGWAANTRFTSLPQVPVPAGSLLP